MTTSTTPNPELLVTRAGPWWVALRSAEVTLARAAEGAGVVHPLSSLLGEATSATGTRVLALTTAAGPAEVAVDEAIEVVAEGAGQVFPLPGMLKNVLDHSPVAGVLQREGRRSALVLDGSSLAMRAKRGEMR